MIDGPRTSRIGPKLTEIGASKVENPRNTCGVSRTQANDPDAAVPKMDLRAYLGTAVAAARPAAADSDSDGDSGLVRLVGAAPRPARGDARSRPWTRKVPF